eukprot:TRINITY_DN14365_c0_g2_i3.p1 TRINITY_DN14365_c0_g2~~TRINITY_DN14365_c0_g2_i3.p1  ORF type:complete len:1807 (+),score=311.26 TRINITY_DN14365_c0_g2_i3:105-5525(+)
MRCVPPAHPNPSAEILPLQHCPVAPHAGEGPSARTAAQIRQRLLRVHRVSPAPPSVLLQCSASSRPPRPGTAAGVRFLDQGGPQKDGAHGAERSAGDSRPSRPRPRTAPLEGRARGGSPHDSPRQAATQPVSYSVSCTDMACIDPIRLPPSPAARRVLQTCRQSSLWLSANGKQQLSRLAARRAAELQTNALTVHHAVGLLRHYWRRLCYGSAAAGCPLRGRLARLQRRVLVSQLRAPWAALSAATVPARAAGLLGQRAAAAGRLLALAAASGEEAAGRHALLRSHAAWTRQVLSAVGCRGRAAAAGYCLCPPSGDGAGSAEWHGQQGAECALRCIALLLGPQPRLRRGSQEQEPRADDAPPAQPPPAQAPEGWQDSDRPSEQRAAQQPAAEQAAEAEPAAEAHPARQPAEQSPADQPTADQPPADQPAADQQPEDGPPEQPAAGGQPAEQQPATGPEQLAEQPPPAEQLQPAEQQLAQQPTPADAAGELGKQRPPPVPGAAAAQLSPRERPPPGPQPVTPAAQPASAADPPADLPRFGSAGSAAESQVPSRISAPPGSGSMRGNLPSSSENPSTGKSSAVDTQPALSFRAEWDSELSDVTALPSAARPLINMHSAEAAANSILRQPRAPRDSRDSTTVSSLAKPLSVFSSDSSAAGPKKVSVSTPEEVAAARLLAKGGALLPGAPLPLPTAGTADGGMWDTALGASSFRADIPEVLSVCLPLPRNAPLDRCTVELTPQHAVLLSAPPRNWRVQAALPPDLSMRQVGFTWDGGSQLVVVNIQITGLAMSQVSSATDTDPPGRPPPSSGIIHRFIALRPVPGLAVLEPSAVSVSVHLHEVKRSEAVAVCSARRRVQITVADSSTVIHAPYLCVTDPATAVADFDEDSSSLTVTAKVAEPLLRRTPVQQTVSPPAQPLPLQEALSTSSPHQAYAAAAAAAAAVAVATAAVSLRSAPAPKGVAEHSWHGSYELLSGSPSARRLPAGIPGWVSVLFHFPDVDSGADLQTDATAVFAVVHRASDGLQLAGESWLWPVHPASALASFNVSTRTLRMSARVCMPGDPPPQRGVSVPSESQWLWRATFRIVQKDATISSRSCESSGTGKLARTGSQLTPREKLVVEVYTPPGFLKQYDVGVDLDDDQLRLMPSGQQRGVPYAVVPLQLPVDPSETQAFLAARRSLVRFEGTIVPHGSTGSVSSTRSLVRRSAARSAGGDSSQGTRSVGSIPAGSAADPVPPGHVASSEYQFGGSVGWSSAILTSANQTLSTNMTSCRSGASGRPHTSFRRWREQQPIASPHVVDGARLPDFGALSTQMTGVVPPALAARSGRPGAGPCGVSHSGWYTWASSSRSSDPAMSDRAARPRRPPAMASWFFRKAVFAEGQPERESIVVEVNLETDSGEELDVGVHERSVCVYLIGEDDTESVLEVQLPVTIEYGIAIATFSQDERRLTVEAPVIDGSDGTTGSFSLPGRSSAGRSASTASEHASTGSRSSSGGPAAHSRQPRAAQQQQPVAPPPRQRPHAAGAGVAPAGSSSAGSVADQAASLRVSSPAKGPLCELLRSLSDSHYSAADAAGRGAKHQYVMVVGDEPAALIGSFGRIRQLVEGRAAAAVHFNDGQDHVLPLSQLVLCQEPVEPGTWVVVLRLSRDRPLNGKDGVVAGVQPSSGTATVVLRDAIAAVKVSLLNLGVASSQAGAPKFANVHWEYAQGAVGCRVAWGDSTGAAAISYVVSIAAPETARSASDFGVDVSEASVAVSLNSAPGCTQSDLRVGEVHFRIAVDPARIVAKYIAASRTLEITLPADADLGNLWEVS